MKTMKLMKMICIALFIGAAFTACKKDKSTSKVAPKVNIQGKWVVNLKVGVHENWLYFIIKSDTEINWFESDKFDGDPIVETYTLTNNLFKTKAPAAYMGDGYTLTATFDSEAGKLINGTLIRDSNNVPEATVSWEATKQQ